MKLHTLNGRITNFFNNRQFYFIYPTIYIIGIITTILFNSTSYPQIVKSSHFSHFINSLFAYKGIYFFNVLFITLFITSCLKNQHSYTKIVKSFLIKYAINFVSLFLIFKIIDSLFIHTGGDCKLSSEDLKELSSDIQNESLCSYFGGDWIEIIPDTFCSITKLSITNAEVCRDIKGSWAGGFDISGHFVFLANNCFIILNEIRILNYIEVDLENQRLGKDWFALDYLMYVNLVCLSVAAIWTYLLLITSVFFHTVLEKGLGLIMSFTSSLIIYHFLHGYL